MKLLIGNQLPRALALWLGERGHDAVHVRDLGLDQSGDLTIWEAAIRDRRIVLSKDEDFFLLATRPGDRGQLLWLRVGNCRTSFLLARMERELAAIEQAFQVSQRIVEVRWK